MALRAAPRQFSTSALLVQPLPLMTGAGAPPRTVRPRRRIVKKLAFRLDAEGSPQGLHAFLEWTPYLYEGPYTVQQCSRRLAVIFIVLEDLFLHRIVFGVEDGQAQKVRTRLRSGPAVYQVLGGRSCLGCNGRAE
jgi:hypothetical protein